MQTTNIENDIHTSRFEQNRKHEKIMPTSTRTY